MAHDPELAHRIRTALGGKKGVPEKAMFGGVGFLLDGNLLVTASGRGGMLVRVGPEGHAAAVASPHTVAMAMGGRAMLGYVNVDAEGVASQKAVASWIERAWAHVRMLPPKRSVKKPSAKAKPAIKAKAATGTKAKAKPAASAKSRARAATSRPRAR